MIDIKQLEEDLYKLGLTKFDMEGKIESIEHQLEMSLYRKENGEEVNYLWLNKAKFKLNMLKIELKKINLEFDKKRKEIDLYHKKARQKDHLRIERVFINMIREDYGNEMCTYYFDRARKYLDYIDGKNEEIEGVKFENRREDTGSKKQD